LRSGRGNSKDDPPPVVRARRGSASTRGTSERWRRRATLPRCLAGKLGGTELSTTPATAVAALDVAHGYDRWRTVGTAPRLAACVRLAQRDDQHAIIELCGNFLYPILRLRPLERSD